MGIYDYQKTAQKKKDIEAERIEQEAIKKIKSQIERENRERMEIFQAIQGNPAAITDYLKTAFVKELENLVSLGDELKDFDKATGEKAVTEHAQTDKTFIARFILGYYEFFELLNEYVYEDDDAVEALLSYFQEKLNLAKVK